MPHVSHQHETAAGKHQLLAGWGCVAAVGVQAPHERRAGAFDACLQVSLHQSQPVAIHIQFLGGGDRGHRILQILDGGDRRLEHDVADAGRIVAPDDVLAIDAKLDVQAVVPQQNRGGRFRRALKPRELARVRERCAAPILEAHLEFPSRDRIANRLVMTRIEQRKMLVQKIPHEANHLRATQRIVSAAAHGAVRLRDHVGAVKSIVEAPPARIGGIQGIASVADRHHQLRAGNARDFRIDIGRRYRESLPFGHQIPDAGQERLVAHRVESRSGMFAMPSIDPRLQLIAPFHERCVARRQIAHQSGEPRPKIRCVDPRARDGFLSHEIVEAPVDLKAIYTDGVGHGASSGLRISRLREATSSQPRTPAML